MRLVAHMINVFYQIDVEKNIFPKGLRLSNKIRYLNIKEINKLPIEDYEDGTILGAENPSGWVIRTHYMGKGTKAPKRIYQIAFEPILEINEKIEDYYLRIRVTNKEQNEDILRYCPNNNMFFSSALVDEDNLVISKSNIKIKGISNNAAGRYFVEIINVNTKVIEKAIPVLVLPASISYEDYLKMIRDLREIREDIIVNNDSKIGIGQRFINKKQNIEEKIRKLELAINRINKKPQTTLTPKYIKKNYNQINKITHKTLLEKTMYPYKKSFTAIDYDESMDIYENRVIKQVLVNLKDKLNEYEEFYDDYIETEKVDIEKVKTYFKNISKESIEERRDYIIKKKKEIKNLISKVINKNNITENSNCMLEIYKNGEFNDNGVRINYSEDIKMFILNINYVSDSIIAGICSENGRKLNTYGKYLNISLCTNNINEMMFLVEKIKNKISRAQSKVTSKLTIKMNISRNSYIKAKIFNVMIDSIYSIDEAKVKIYSEKQKIEFIKKYIGDENDEETLAMLEAILQKESNINEIKEKFKGENSWDMLRLRINKLLMLSMFSDINIKEINYIRPTQIFVNDNSYRKAYKAIKDLNKNTLIVSMKSPEAILVKSTCDIYEIWCLFKIVQLLIIKQNWKLLNNIEVAQGIEEFMKIKEPYSDKQLEFKFIKDLDNGISISLELIYEGRVNYGEGKYKTPDYQFIYTINDENGNLLDEIRVYLDAKYRNYSSQGQGMYIRDIEDVAINKYIKTFEGSKNKAVCSMIVHSDKNDKYINWGGDCDERDYLSEKLSVKLRSHGYGAFYLVPSDISNLNKFLRLLSEYHLKSEEVKTYFICWECGEVKGIEVKEKFTSGNYKKYHCKCNICKEFWVKNHCKGQGHHDLIKHKDNYHLLNNESNNPWHLICPKCGNGKRYEEG